MFAEDLAPFFDTVGGFAAAYVFNGNLSVACIFDNVYLDALGVAGTSPRLVGSTAALATIVRGHTVVVASVTYTVVNVEPDGTGITTLQLERT